MIHITLGFLTLLHRWEIFPYHEIFDQYLALDKPFSPQLTVELQEIVFFSFFNSVAGCQGRVPVKDTFKFEARPITHSIFVMNGQISIELHNEGTGIQLQHPSNLKTYEERDFQKADEQNDISGYENKSSEESSSEVCIISFTDPHAYLEPNSKASIDLPGWSSPNTLERRLAILELIILVQTAMTS